MANILGQRGIVGRFLYLFTGRCKSRSTRFHVFPSKVLFNGFCRLHTCGNGTNGHTGTGLNIPTGKDSFAMGFKGDVIHFSGSPTGKGYVIIGCNGSGVRGLSNGQNQLINGDVILTSRDGNGSSSSGFVGFAQFHAKAFQPGEEVIFTQNFLGCSEVYNLNAFGLGGYNFFLPGGHLLPGPAVENGGCFSPQSYGASCHINGHISATDDGHMFTHTGGPG